MSIDRRQFKRFETLLIVEIGPQKESASYFFGITKNVSFEGFIFESQNYDLRPGDILEFCLKHPQSKLSVPVLGEIVWNSETKFECYSGVKFHRFDDETKSKVFELISADNIEHSDHVPPDKEGRSAVQRNERAESGIAETDGILSDSIGQAANPDNSNPTGLNDLPKRIHLPGNVEKHKDDLSDESAKREDPGDTVDIIDQAPAVKSIEGGMIQENVSRTANGSTAARRKGYKKRSSYPLVAAVFIALFIAAGLMIFMSDEIREKITPPELSSQGINYTDAVTQDGRTPAMNETGASEPSPAQIDQSENFPEYDKETLGEQALSASGNALDQNGSDELPGHDNGATAEQLPTMHTTDEIILAQNKKMLLKEAERESDQPAVSLQDHTAGAKGEGRPDHNVLNDSGDKEINKTRVEASITKKEEVQKIVKKIRATVKKEPEPLSPSVKGKSAEKSVAPEEIKNLHQMPVTKISETASNKETAKSKKISNPEKDSLVNQKKNAVLKPDYVAGNENTLKTLTGQKKVTSVSSNKKKETKVLPLAVKEKTGVQESVELRQPDRVSGDASKSIKTVPSLDKEKVKEIQIAKNVSGNNEKKNVQSVESVKKSNAGVENAPVIQKASTPVRQTPTETSIVKKDIPKIKTTESVVIEERPERKEPLTMSEPKMQKVENVSKKVQSKKPAGMDRRPKIALILNQNQSKSRDVKNTQSELTDEYLGKYYSAYTDFFDDNSNKWDIFDIGAASARIEAGRYHIKNKKEGGALIVLHYLSFPHNSDFVLETRIMKIKAGAENSYGVIFGAKDARDNYSFQIRENKYYSVKKYHKGVSGYVTTGEIKGSLTDKKSAALLKIVKRADVIEFYVNNGYVDKVTNLAFYGNQIGFIVEGKSHIAVDYTRSYIRKADHEVTK